MKPLLSLFFVFCLACVGFSQTEPLKKFPIVDLVDNNYNTISTSILSNNRILVYYFAAQNWCKPCKDALNSISDNHQLLIDTYGLKIIAVSTQFNPFEVTANNNLIYSDYSYITFYWDKEMILFKKHNLSLYPQFFLLDDDFNIIVQAESSNGLATIIDYLKKNALMLSNKEDVNKSENLQLVEEICFPGGEAAMLRFLQKNVHYPEYARNKGIQGTVIVSFVVDSSGKVTDVKLLRGIGGGCDEEAVRVVKVMPDWNPGKVDGIPVRVQFNIPIKFSLTKNK
jgi:TonB family protein